MSWEQADSGISSPTRYVKRVRSIVNVFFLRLANPTIRSLNNPEYQHYTAVHLMSTQSRPLPVRESYTCEASLYCNVNALTCYGCNMFINSYSCHHNVKAGSYATLIRSLQLHTSGSALLTLGTCARGLQ